MCVSSVSQSEVSQSADMSQSAPALGIADAEIKVAHAQLSDVLINTLRRSEYSFACFARCREFGLSGPLPPKGGR